MVERNATPIRRAETPRLRAHEREARLEVIARRTIGVGAANFGVLIALSHLYIDSPPWVDGIVVGLVLVAVVVSTIWFVSRFWVHGVGAVLFGLIADFSVLAGALTLLPHEEALYACMLFSITGVFVLFYLSRAWLLVHVAFTSVVTLGIGAWLVTAELGVLYILVRVDVVLASVVGTTLTTHLAWATMRRRADMAATDPLTGIRNLRGMWRDAPPILADAEESGDVVAVVVADIDAFKQVNDEHGHDVGDEVLVGVAHTLSAHIGPAGLVARSGGEEFTMLVRGSLDGVRALVGSIPTTCSGGVNPSVSMSVGAAVVEPHSRLTAREATQEARRRADRIMYEVKRSGGDGVGLHF